MRLLELILDSGDGGSKGKVSREIRYAIYRSISYPVLMESRKTTVPNCAQTQAQKIMIKCYRKKAMPPTSIDLIFFPSQEIFLRKDAEKKWNESRGLGLEVDK